MFLHYVQLTIYLNVITRAPGFSNAKRNKKSQIIWIQ